MAKMKPINMESDTFDQLKTDMTNSLNKLLCNMQDYDAEKASMTVKVTITLADQELDNGAHGSVPTFEHKVSIALQFKDTVDGKLDGEYTLEGDGHGGHILRPISGQIDMFEEPVEE